MSQTKDFWLKSSVMVGEGVRHPTPPIQMIVTHFSFNSNINVLKKIFRYLAFDFWKNIMYNQYIWVFIYIYHIMWIFLANNYLQTKQMKYMYITCESLLCCKNNTNNLTCEYYLLHI